MPLDARTLFAIPVTGPDSPGGPSRPAHEAGGYTDALRLILIAILVALAALLWFAFVRRAPQESALATIRSKSFREAGTYTQHAVGAQRGFRTPTHIPIAESYVFELRLEGVPDPVLASFNTVKSRQFEVDQRVRVDFVRRGLPPFWQRIAVVDMFPVETP